MKKLLFSLTLLAATCTSLLAQTADETAIKALCSQETRTWLDNDKAGHDACWQIRPYSFVAVSLADGTLISLNSETMKATSDAAMGSGGTFTDTNYQIQVNGNTAWASYDQNGTDSKGTKASSKEIRLLEKVNGVWKIVAISSHYFKVQ